MREMHGNWWRGDCKGNAFGLMGYFINNNGPLGRPKFGLVTSKVAAATLGVTAGYTVSDDYEVGLRLVSSLQKTLGAFAAGSGAGSLDTGVVAVAKWYYPFIILNEGTGAVDVLVSLSPTAPVMPSGYNRKRRIGSFRTYAASAAIMGFKQITNKFIMNEAAESLIAPAPFDASVLLAGNSVWQTGAVNAPVIPGLFDFAFDWDSANPTEIANLRSIYQNDAANGLWYAFNGNTHTALGAVNASGVQFVPNVLCDTAQVQVVFTNLATAGSPLATVITMQWSDLGL